MFLVEGFKNKELGEAVRYCLKYAKKKALQTFFVKNEDICYLGNKHFVITFHPNEISAVVRRSTMERVQRSVGICGAITDSMNSGKTLLVDMNVEIPDVEAVMEIPEIWNSCSVSHVPYLYTYTYQTLAVDPYILTGLFKQNRSVQLGEIENKRYGYPCIVKDRHFTAHISPRTTR